MGNNQKPWKRLLILVAIATLLPVFHNYAIADASMIVALSSSSINENMPVGSVVGDISVTNCTGTPSVLVYDAANLSDPSPVLSANFDIQNTGGTYQLITNASFDRETTSSYGILLQVTDDNATPDEAGDDVIQTVYESIAIGDVNDNAPVASDDSLVTSEDTPIKKSVLATDADSTSTISYTRVENTSHGNLVFNTSGAYTYTPSPNFHGSDSFTFTASDGTHTSDTKTVLITVTSVEDPPVNTVTPSVGGTMHPGHTLTADQGSWNDAADGGTSTLTYSYQWQTSPTGTGSGSDIGGATDETYDLTAPDCDQYIRIKVSCSDWESSAEAYSPWYHIVNSAPVITEGSTVALSFLEDEAAKDLPFSATDEDGDSLTWRIASNGSKGTAVLTGSTAAFTPAANQNGSDSFVISVSDGYATDSITVSVTIAPINDAPSFTMGSDQEKPEDCGAQTVSNWATAISAGPSNEGAQQLNFIVTNDNSALFSKQPALSTAGTLTYTPAINANGSATVTVKLQDNGGTEGTGAADTSAAQTFTITVNAVNDAPSFTKGANQNVSEDCAPQAIANWATAISAGPSNEREQLLDFIVTNDNNALFSAQPAISTAGTLTYTPAANAYGSATVTVKLYDNGGKEGTGAADTSAAQTFTITVNAANDTPTLTGAAAATTDEDTPYIYSFTVEDVEDAPAALTIAYDTDNTLLIPKANMVLGGSGAFRTVTLTPEPNQYGTACLTFTVKDSTGAAATQTVLFTVNSSNDAPGISEIANRTIEEDTSTVAIGFAISDVDLTDLSGVEVTVTSDHPSVIDAAGMILGGSGANRNVTITPVENAYGTATITVTADDKSGGISTETFAVEVKPVNDAPTLTDIADQTINEDGSTGPLSFTIADVDDTRDRLTVTASVDNTALVTRANIVVNTSVSPATITMTPESNKFGAATVTVTVRDSSGHSASDTFLLTVNSVNDAPTLSPVLSQTTQEDTSKSFTVSIGDVETPVSGLTMSAVSSSNLPLIPTDGITFSGSGSTRTVTMTPEANIHGTSDITIRVTDGNGGFAERSFPLTVDSVNDSPTFIKGAEITELEDCGPKTYFAWATAILAGPADEVTAGQTVSFTVTNDNAALFAVAPAISPSGDFSFTPADHANGIANVTVTAVDSPGAASASQTVPITITAVNDPPTVSDTVLTLDTDENKSYRGYLAASDIDQDALVFSISQEPDKHGTVRLLDAATGAFEYTPAPHFSGTETFQFSVSDGRVSAEAKISMRVKFVNDPPEANGFSISTNEDAPKTFSLTGQVSDTDSDPTSLTYYVDAPPTHGTVTCDKSTGACSYTPNGHYNGADFFTFKANDGTFSSNTAPVYITITP